MKLGKVVLALAIALALPTAWAADAPQAERDPLFKPIEAVAPKDPAKVELGKKLYFDPRLSKSGAISCNSCHNLSMGGQIISLPLSVINGKKV